MLINNYRFDGIAYDETPITEDYSNKYLDKFKAYKENACMNSAINEARCELVSIYAGLEQVLDIGCGNMDFMALYHTKNCPLIYGYDVIPDTVKALQVLKAYVNPYHDYIGNISVITMFDVLEHIADIDALLDKMPALSYIITSIPIYESLDDIKDSPHYRPGEHIWYFTDAGIKSLMNCNDYKYIESTDIETDIGRQDIRTYVFRKK